MPTVNDCNADTLANSLFTSLTADAPTAPTLDLTDEKFSFTPDKTSILYQDVTDLTISDLTAGDLEGEGVFDKLMASVDLHISREFDAGRITSDQYAEAYVQIMAGVLQNSTQFLLSKEKAHWDAITAQMQARIAEIEATSSLVQLETAKAEAQKMIFDMLNSGSEYGLTKMKIANADAEHCMIKASTRKEEYSVDFLLPAELAIQSYQRMEVLPSTVAINKVQADRLLPAESAIKEFINREIQPLEKGIQSHKLNIALPIETDIQEFQRDSILPVTLGIEQHKLNQQMPAQTTLLKEQAEVQRAQTMETRSDGLTAVLGVVNLQKDTLLKDIETKQYALDNTLPIQLDLVKEQRENERAKTLDTRSDGITAVTGVVGLQKESLQKDVDTKQYALDNTLPIQLDLVKEQREAERAKTLDTRSDTTVVVGSVGKQKDLYSQQIDSFVKESQHKTAKMFLDAWITQKTLDEFGATPVELQSPGVDAVMANVRQNNNL